MLPANACDGFRRWSRTMSMDLIRQYKPEDLPPALTSYVEDRGQLRLQASLRSRKRQREFCFGRSSGPVLLLGPPRRITRRLRELAERGRDPVQYLPDVRRRRTNFRDLQRESFACFPESGEEEHEPIYVAACGAAVSGAEAHQSVVASKRNGKAHEPGVIIERLAATELPDPTSAVPAPKTSAMMARQLNPREYS